MILVCRNDPTVHPMLKQVLNSDANFNILEKRFFNKIYVVKCPGDKNLLLCDDPFAMIYGRLFQYTKNTHMRLWALEMWEHQVPLKGIRSWLRYLVFSLASCLSYFICDSILFPSETRRLYLCNKFALFNLYKKSQIILNIPEFFTGNSFLEGGVHAKFEKFRTAHKTLLIYAGSLQAGRLLEELVCGKNTSSDVGLVFCGSGSMESVLSAAEKTNASILFLGNLNQSELSYVYQHSDIGILTYDNKLLNTRMCAPLKLWEYLYYNLLIIGNENEALMGEWSKYIDGYYDSASDIYELIDGMCTSKSFKNIPKFDRQNVITV
jgi:hypothetical protein